MINESLGPDVRLFFVEFNRISPVVANVAENKIKIRMLVDMGRSNPLYDKNPTMVESIMATVVKVRMRITEALLDRPDDPKFIILRLVSRGREDI
jgi:hypothetical protein